MGGSLGSSGKTWASKRERNRAEHCVFLEPVPECYSLVGTFNVAGICESCYNFIGTRRIARACFVLPSLCWLRRKLRDMHSKDKIVVIAYRCRRGLLKNEVRPDRVRSPCRVVTVISFLAICRCHSNVGWRNLGFRFSSFLGLCSPIRIATERRC